MARRTCRASESAAHRHRHADHNLGQRKCRALQRDTRGEHWESEFCCPRTETEPRSQKIKAVSLQEQTIPHSHHEAWNSNCRHQCVPYACWLHGRRWNRGFLGHELLNRDYKKDDGSAPSLSSQTDLLSISDGFLWRLLLLWCGSNWFIGFLCSEGSRFLVI